MKKIILIALFFNVLNCLCQIKHIKNDSSYYDTSTYSNLGKIQNVNSVKGFVCYCIDSFGNKRIDNNTTLISDSIGVFKNTVSLQISCGESKIILLPMVLNNLKYLHDISILGPLTDNTFPKILKLDSLDRLVFGDIKISKYPKVLNSLYKLRIITAGYDTSNRKSFRTFIKGISKSKTMKILWINLPLNETINSIEEYKKIKDRKTRKDVIWARKKLGKIELRL